jgi:hypothetical protein
MSLNEDENEQIKEEEEQQQAKQPKMPSLINKRKQNTILIKKAHKVANDHDDQDHDDGNEVEHDDNPDSLDDIDHVDEKLNKKRSNGNYHSDSDDHIETEELDDEEREHELFDEQQRDGVDEEFYSNEQIEEDYADESELYNGNNNNTSSFMQEDTEDAEVYEQAHVEETNGEVKEDEEPDVQNEDENEDDDENDQDFMLGHKKSVKKPKRRFINPTQPINYDNNVSMLIKTVTSLAKKHQQAQVNHQKSKPNASMTPAYNKTVTNSSESKLTSNTNMPNTQANGNSKKQMRFQCRFCAYKSHSVSLMQNHIYRHIDTTPYSCFYCGHKSTTKSTIMVHIELCHPNMEVKIKESRVREEDYYLDLNSSSSSSCAASQMSSLGNELTNKIGKNVPKGFKSSQPNPEDKFEIIPNKCSNKRKHEDECNKPSINNQLNTSSNPSSTVSSPSMYSSPSISPVQTSTLTTVTSKSTHGHKTGKDEHNDNFIQLHNPNLVQMEGDEEQMGDANSNGNYVTVFNRPKQYFGSLYEPDKQYSCKLCTYTTNHKPSMEDHVYVHTNKRPYR